MFSLLMKSEGYWAHQCRPVNHSGNLAILGMKKSPVKEKGSDWKKVQIKDLPRRKTIHPVL